MQKHLLIIFSFVVLTMSHINASEWSLLHRGCIAAGFGIMAYAGKYATDLNTEYTKANKKPDWKMRLSKTIGAAAVLLVTDFLTNDTSDTKSNLCKLGAFTLSLLATHSRVGVVVGQVPIVGGFLSDPIRYVGNDVEKPEERKDFGAVGRFVLTYIPLRAVMGKYFNVHI